MPDDTYRHAGRPTKAESIAAARALLRSEKANHCTHGVRRAMCADCRGAETEEERK